MDTTLPDDEELVGLRDFFRDPANHAPRAACPVPDLTGAGAAEAAPSVFDPVTGRVRVMDGKCGTCIGRPGNPYDLTPERRSELLGRRPDGTYDEGWTVCHSPLPDNPDHLPAAVCAWIALHPQAGPRSLALRIAAHTGIDHITPPTH
ncbi:hypothetical protein GCM10010371_63590 [Streptomyces subrutilus]|uniref:Uncharacterized protein n=1 Tax=Streptomyces subrutilus TaxID=36818 RepID=A0A918RFN2_9ACTN|nr:hypothetical protein [Streptomyces subrutilus]GGZ94993.1 hypothetical protein GCM10010371_63590 [Streptomyces subrutilus]